MSKMASFCLISTVVVVVVITIILFQRKGNQWERRKVAGSPQSSPSDGQTPKGLAIPCQRAIFFPHTYLCVKNQNQFYHIQIIRITHTISGGGGGGDWSKLWKGKGNYFPLLMHKLSVLQWVSLAQVRGEEGRLAEEGTGSGTCLYCQIQLSPSALPLIPPLPPLPPLTLSPLHPLCCLPCSGGCGRPNSEALHMSLWCLQNGHQQSPALFLFHLPAYFSSHSLMLCLSPGEMTLLLTFIFLLSQQTHFDLSSHHQHFLLAILPQTHICKVFPVDSLSPMNSAIMSMVVFFNPGSMSQTFIMQILL